MVQYMRSLLYASPIEEDRLLQVAESDADMIILDLESLVPNSQKATARNQVSIALDKYDFDDHITCVRINELHSKYWLKDIMMALESPVEAIRIPDVRRPSDIQTIVDICDTISTPPDIYFQLESPEGIIHGPEIAEVCKSHQNVVGVGLGVNDYLSTLTAAEDTAEAFITDHVGHMISGIAAAGDLIPLGCVYRGTSRDGLTEHARRLRGLGHYGQPILEIDHVSVVNDIYTECYG